MNKRNVCIITFGCQMNKLDSELVAEALTAAGHGLTCNEDDADVILFNTCSVRDNAENRVYSRLMQLKNRKKENPSLLLGIMGCFAQRKGEGLLQRIPHLDIICGTRQFPNIAGFIEQAEAGPVIATEESSLTAPGVLDAHGRGLHKGVQAYVSIMRGCNNFCTYCIVPYVRGREESRPISAIVEEARGLAAKGVKELTLLGQNIDAYGKDIGSSLSALLREVHKIEEFVRIRFVTSHPKDISTELITTMHELPRVCNYLHMPAQSGSTKILTAMHRGYTRNEYDEKLAAIRLLAPGTLVTSDFIVGFPGETEEDFEMTLELMREAKFQTSYIFKYSPRPGTVAEKRFPDNVPEEEKKRRNQALLSVQEEVNRNRMDSLVGSTQEIMVEGLSQKDKTKLIGRTSTNLICVFDAPENHEELVGTLVNLEIDSCSPLTLFGHSI